MDEKTTKDGLAFAVTTHEVPESKLDTLEDLPESQRPTGLTLWLIAMALMSSVFLVALDIQILGPYCSMLYLPPRAETILALTRLTSNNYDVV